MCLFVFSIHVLTKNKASWQEVIDRKLTKDSIDCIRLSPGKLTFRFDDNES